MLRQEEKVFLLLLLQLQTIHHCPVEASEYNRHLSMNSLTEKGSDLLRSNVKDFIRSHNFEYDIFLSHSSKDIGFVKDIFETLSNFGLRVFSANDSLKKSIGQSYFDKIQEALNKSKHFVLVSTPDAMQSHWVKTEYETFFNHIHIHDREQRMLIVLHGKDFSYSLLPMFLRNIQIAENLHQILESILDKNNPGNITEIDSGFSANSEDRQITQKGSDNNLIYEADIKTAELWPDLLRCIRQEKWGEIVGIIKAKDESLSKDAKLNSSLQECIRLIVKRDNLPEENEFYSLLADLFDMHKFNRFQFKLNAKNFTLIVRLLITYSLKTDKITDACYYATELPDENLSIQAFRELEIRLPRKISFGSAQSQAVSILIIDDDLKIRSQILEFIQERHEEFHIREVIQAIDGEDGYNQFIKYHPDIIITDNIMPRLSGLQMLTRIKRDFNKLDYKVIIISSFVETDYLLKSIELMVDYFIDKEDLGNKLVSCLKQATNEVVLKKKLENKEKELISKNEIIEDSFKYAVRIQKAIMSDLSELPRFFPESFVIFQPKEFLSSDFYWFRFAEGQYYIVVADCAGNNIAGSMLGIFSITYLNRFVIQDKMTDPAEILEHINLAMIESLNHETAVEYREWLNIALLKWDINSNTLYYSGANMPVYLVEDSNARELQTDLISLGNKDNIDIRLTNHSIKIRSNCTLYLGTEGFLNQTHRSTGETFGKRRYVEMIEELSGKPMNIQKIIIDQKINQWVGDSEISDDILIIGLKMNPK